MTESKSLDTCYHCDLPVPLNSQFQVTVLGEEREMCCPGCQAVAESIVSAGLEDYYRYRTEKAVKGDPLLESTMDALSAFDDPAIQDEFVSVSSDISTIQLTVEGITCAACAWLIEKQVGTLPGIKQIAVNTTNRRLTVKWDNAQLPLSRILKTLEKFGYHALPFQPDQHEATYQKEDKRFLKKLGLSGLMTMQVMMLAVGLYFGLFGYIEEETKVYFHWVSLVLTTPVVFYGGAQFYSSAINGIKGGVLNMDVSVSIAIWGTFIASAWATISNQGQIYFESVCMFTFLLLISRYLEHRSRHKAALISANMLKYQPLTATIVKDGQFESVVAKHLTVGDVVLIKAGETIPLDGVIVEGDAAINESMLTGEFAPVRKHSGDAVYGGTVNETNAIQVKITAAAKDSLINQIVLMQELALSQKPRIARFADRTSQQFIFWVLVIAIVSFGVWWFFIDTQQALWVAIAVLVATCPCALSLATPSALSSAVANLNEKGMLVRHADALENLADITTVAFDKTGTLTEGVFSLESILAIEGQNKNRLLHIAASIESHSEHPIAKAFSSAQQMLKVSDITVLAGQGISATYEGVRYTLGNRSALTSSIPDAFSHCNVLMQQDGMCVAGFVVTDTIKDDARDLSRSLSAYTVRLISGDNKKNVESVAEQVGILHTHYDMQPQDKMFTLQELQQAGERVLMVGDGINDAPVLAQADVSVAVSEATDLARQSADVLLLNKQISGIQFLIQMARKTRQKVKQNMAWAIGYNLLILPLAVTGFLTPWMAVIGMSLSSIIVVSNSTRLLRYGK
ncbi:heavy metal translocating P-type ATPase [Aestuariibacter sp. AA17]|uniref:Heavy metal translocating P-type ATPase n=1 Tax=Fluctibacter corallii TaxID=2984329 RepID=A0ABT3A6B7_9ALTE|nr:heavy metal translocating P-type ATPase [Aestuariibacter sp. AA17]MCV2884211.1 heavy metal translocating P-type ATPase [Aestuariibacter sp. AA17]